MPGDIKPPTPHRHFEVTVHVSGDTWPEVQHELEELAAHVSAHGPACSSVSGGYSTAHTVSVVVDPTMTKERFHVELEAYVQWLKAQKELGT